MNIRNWSGNWAMGLSPEQRATVTRLRLAGRNKKEATDGWTVYLMPSTGTPTYVELRHYVAGGGVSRWVVERDGSVSAHNDGGRLRQLVPVGAEAA